MENSILSKTLLFIRNKQNYTEEERKELKKSLFKEAENILVNLIDKVNID